MPSKKYRLQYLPLFYEDLEEKITYIAVELGNPQAANDLLDKAENAILERLPNICFVLNGEKILSGVMVLIDYINTMM